MLNLRVRVTTDRMSHLKQPIPGSELKALRGRVGVSLSAMARLLGLPIRTLDAFEAQAIVDPPEGHPARPLLAVYGARAAVVDAAEGCRKRGAGA